MKKSLFLLAALFSMAMAHDVTLSLPDNGITNNAGLGKQKSPHMTCNSFDFTRKEGSFMCNFGELCPTNESTGEGILVTKEGSARLTLCPRADVGGSAQIIALQGKEISNMSIYGFTFEIGASHSEKVTGFVNVEVIIFEKTTIPGFAAHASEILAVKSQGLPIGSGASIYVPLETEIASWNPNHFITICIHNHGKKLEGANDAPYTLSNIRLIAHSSTNVEDSAQDSGKEEIKPSATKKKKKKSNKRKKGKKKKK